jgi:hypothetical protein
LPDGWYVVNAIASELKPTKDGTGAYLEMTLKVLEPPHAGRQLFYRLNIKNNNPVAQEIAYKQLSAICHAVGVLQVEDSAQLHGLPFKVKVTIRKDETGKYDPSNEIKAVKSVNEQGAAPALATAAGTNAAPAWVAPAPAHPAAAAQAAAPAVGSLPPWLQAKA